MVAETGVLALRWDTPTLIELFESSLLMADALVTVLSA